MLGIHGGSRMLSENLQHRIRGNETAQPCVPHRSKVFARGLFNDDGKPLIGFPYGFAIGRKASCERLRINRSS